MVALTRTLLVCCAGCALAGAAYAAGLTQAQAIEARKRGTNEAYSAAGSILECLSLAKQGKDTSGLVLEAKNHLELAKVGYSDFTRSDRAKAPVRHIDDKGLADQLALVKVRLSWDNIKDLRTEGEVAQANLMAIDKLQKQISDWKSCSDVLKSPSELLKLLENKILLERTSQVAEGTWDY